MKKKTVKAWAVVMFDGFIPDFQVQGKMLDVYQIHSSSTGANKLVRDLNKNTKKTGEKETLWFAVPCTITYQLPLNPKSK